MSTDIPRARKELKEIASGLADRDAAAAIEAIVDTLMIRSFTGRKTPVKHRRMTDELAFEVRTFTNMHPTMSHEEIGRLFDINAGRVSEVMAGKRFVNGRATKS